MVDKSRSPLVFISHNKADKPAARELAIYLTADNVGVWFDEWDIKPGDSIVSEVDAGLRSCSHVLLLWSEHASRSKWVEREASSGIGKALQTGRPRILPVILDDTPVPSLLTDVMYIKYQGGTEDDRRNIINAVTGHAPSDNLIRAIVKKYNEVIIDPDGEGPFNYKACPRCGCSHLQGSSMIDEEHDREYFMLGCTECDWSEHTE